MRRCRHRCGQAQGKSLLLAPLGEEVVILDIQTCGGSRRRLMDLGVKEGLPVKLISTQGRALIIEINGAKYCISKRLAEGILIKE